MSRYIDEILQTFDDINFVYNDCTRYDTLKRMLEELTADVVEVVRCEDCDFWQTDWIPNHGGDRGCHYCEMMDTFTEPLNYCGYAERKILPKD